MRLDIHVHFHHTPAVDVGGLLRLILSKVDTIMAKTSEVTTAINAAVDALNTVATNQQAASDQLAKATAEIIAAVSNQDEASPELQEAATRLQAAVDALGVSTDGIKAAAQTLDDLNPDAAPPSG